MSFAQGIAGAGVALAAIAIMLLHVAATVVIPENQQTRAYVEAYARWRLHLTWGCGALVASGFLIGLGAVG